MKLVTDVSLSISLRKEHLSCPMAKWPIVPRYMFANPAVQPKRLPTADFLLKGGQSASWILGTMIVTVTTSICDQTSTRTSGFCDRCHLVCKSALKTAPQSWSCSNLPPFQGTLKVRHFFCFSTLLQYFPYVLKNFQGDNGNCPSKAGFACYRFGVF